MATKPVNDDFDLDAELNDVVVEEPPAPKKKAAPKKPAAKFIDPEDDRKNWPTIRIEDEVGKPNYEFLAAHGTKKNGKSFSHELQIERNEDVQVPPSIVYALQDAVATKYTQRRDLQTQRNIMVPHNSSTIPWRMVKGGKYF